MPARDCVGSPFEMILELRRDDQSFGTVGQRCGHLLADLAARLRDARADGSNQARRWPDPDDRFPDPGQVGGPAEPELFAFRYRDRGDVLSTGELRCSLRTSAVWVTDHWRVSRRAVVDAWGAGGRGVRAVLTSGGLADFLEEVLAEAGRSGASYGDMAGKATSGRSRR